MIHLVVFICAMSVAHAEGDGGYVPEARSNSEVFTSKVTKVLSFQEEDGEYVAYLVTWKGHEVAVAAYGSLANDKRYNVGDVVRCQMLQSTHRIGDPSKSRVSFTLMPAGFTSGSPAEEVQRLEAIRSEIESRRLKRAGATAVPPKGDDGSK